MAKSVDPHKVFSNLRNSDIENLQFYAELKVTRRSRIANTIGGDDSFVLNFNGYSNNDKIYTTEWTNGNENFGIKNIDIEINASYVPKVYIEFIDIRGQSLFTDAPNSKYKCMFELPPPIFDLTIKGYYGKPVSYRLHMVKQNTRWDRGSYIIKAEFIGLTFAPLADMMVDYLNVAPFLSNNLNDKSYVNFIKTTKKVINKIEKEVNTYMEDVSVNEERITQLTDINKGGDILKTMMNSFNEFIKGHEKYNYFSCSVDTDGDFRVLRIWGKKYNRFDDAEFYESHSDFYNNDLKVFVGEEIRKYEEILPKNKTFKINTFDSLLKIKTEYSSIIELRVDISYNSINKIEELISLEQNKIDDKKGKINDIKKSIVISEGDLSLKNVLGIIMENAKVFYDELKNLVKLIESKNRGGTAGKSNDLSKYAFPEFWGDKIENGINKTVKMHPNGGEYDTWDEIGFINKYIEAKKQVQVSLSELTDNSLISINTDENNYISINDTFQEFFKHNNVDNILNDYISRNIEIMTYFEKIIKNDGLDNEINVVANELHKKTMLGDVFLSKYANGYKDYIRSLPSFNKYSNYVYPNKNSTRIIDYHEGNIDFRVIQKDNNFFISFNTTYENHPIYIGEEYYDKGSDSYVNEYRPFALEHLFKDFMKDVYNEKSPISLDRFCQILKEDLNNNIVFSKYFTSKPSVFGFLADMFNSLGGEINTHKGHGIYIVPRIYLILFRYMHNDDLKKIPDLYRVCNIEYENNRYKPIAISEEMKLLVDPVSFTTHPNVSYLFEPVSLRIIGNDVYGTSDQMLTEIETNMRNNVDIERLNNGLMKIRKKLTDLKTTSNENNKGTAETRINTSIEQSELKTQLYYTFKSFIDKWIYSSPEDVDNMFSLDNFLTVDRGFNDIGSDVIMDLSPLYNLEYSVDTSLYTLLLNLLGKNNFNFFALPSYINYSGDLLWGENNIEQVFGTFQPIEANASPKFICMYIGGVSSSLDIKLDNSFESDSGSVEELIGMDNIQSFRVDIGTGNQSFFLDVELDQQEYKETNESIILLDEITKNNGNPNKIATNSLINIYEQRSYTATVPMLGCAMIQPTMYFELNVPMFKGTYLILDVRHNLQPNKMTTIFKGVRIPKVSKPYVNDMRITTNNNNNVLYGDNSGLSQSVSIASFFKDSTLVSNAKASIKERAFLDMIAWAEGMDDYKSKYLGYDIIIGGKTIPNWTPETPTKFPITSGYSASGRYQMIKSTWMTAFNGKYANLDFSITNQDEIALELMRGQFKRFKNLNIENVNRDNFVYYVDALAPQWASLPFFNKSGVYTKKMIPYENWVEGLSIYGLENNTKGGRNQWNPKNTIQKLWEIFSESLNVGENKIVNLTGISKENASFLSKLHPKAQNTFATFIRDIERNTDYNVILTSGYRNYIPSGSAYEASPNSLHMVGLAIDMNLVSRNGGLQLMQNSSKSSWLSTKVPDIANKYNIYWGGYFSDPDKIHFELKDIRGNRFSGSIMNDYKDSRKLSNLNALSYEMLSDINIKKIT